MRYPTLLLVFVGLAALTVGLGSCDNSPTRSGGPRKPACWKPLVSEFGTPGIADASPAWSPSGKFVAYTSFFDSCNDAHSAVYITDSTGIPKDALSIDGSVVRWLPGDSLLVVNTGVFIGGELVIHNINTDSTSPLGVFTRSPIFDVSADGRFIYYSGEPLDSTAVDGIYRYDLEQKISTPIVAGGHPAISPDGTKIALFKGPLYVFDMMDSALILVSPEGDTPDWTPDGTRIVHTDGIGKMFVTDLAGNSTELLGEHGMNGAFGPISVHPNGQSVLFNKHSMDNFTHIWQVNLDGTGLREFSR